MSTNIIHQPQGTKADALRKWASANKITLAYTQTRVSDVRQPSQERTITTVAALRKKKVKNTLQEEKHWLDVTVSEADMEKLHAYIGCVSCGRGTEAPPGHTFSCKACEGQQRVASPKVTFSFVVSDETGDFPITTFTEANEKLFNMPAPEIFKLAMSDDHGWFDSIATKIFACRLLIELGPKLTMFRNKVLQWGVRDLVVQREEIDSSADAEPLQLGEVATPKDLSASGSNVKEIVGADKITTASGNIIKKETVAMVGHSTAE